MAELRHLWILAKLRAPPNDPACEEKARDESLGHMMKSADGGLCMKTDYVREGSGEDRGGIGKERPLKQEKKICLTRSSKIFPATTTVP